MERRRSWEDVRDDKAVHRQLFGPKGLEDRVELLAVVVAEDHHADAAPEAVVWHGFKGRRVDLVGPLLEGLHGGLHDPRAPVLHAGQPDLASQRHAVQDVLHRDALVPVPRRLGHPVAVEGVLRRPGATGRRLPGQVRDDGPGLDALPARRGLAKDKVDVEAGRGRGDLVDEGLRRLVVADAQDRGTTVRFPPPSRNTIFSAKRWNRTMGTA